ncbi:MAG: hypothetical protein MRZ79_27665 [Bacteroidia bacterium]|nr:hypothetical protein [Bacteroidia bacterium]
MMKRYLIYLLGSAVATLGLLTLNSCEQKEEQQLTAQEIVDASILAHGGQAYENLKLKFDFRDKTYRIARDGEVFTYERQFEKDGETIKDVLDDGSFQRVLNGSVVEVPDTMARKYSNSVNSVAYFVQLPYLLNDGAVNKRFLGKVKVKGVEYYKVEVTFSAEGGGDDFDDTYVYWFRTDNFEMDFLAYDFHVNGGGVRFREAYNPREEGGVRIQDYVNYKADHTLYRVYEMDSLFEKGALKELSRIETLLGK